MHSVVENAEKVRVITSTGEKINACILGCDYTGKISVLKIENYNISTLPKITSWNRIHTGNEVFFFGVVPGMSVAVNFGLINDIRPSDGIIKIYASGNPGTSGTPVFDRNENVLGLLAFKLDSTDSISQKIPSKTQNTYLVISLEQALVLAHSVINNVEHKCGWLGLIICLKSSAKEVILVKDVIKDSPAFKSGIKPSDFIVEFNGIPISTPHQLSETITNTKVKDIVTIKILRGDKLLTFDVTLAHRPNSKYTRQ